MAAYYNENDPFCAQWLRNLIAAGHVAPGDVDERSIVEIKASDLVGYRQCHFFAGVAVWSYALRQAGWSDERSVWTGSCPCQPFSAAGRRDGRADERHLWPHWARLIGECRPDVIFGEQVSSRDGLAWLDFVCADLEAAGYAVGALDTCAAGFGAPHIRQRLYFVGESNGAGSLARWHASATVGYRRSIKPASSADFMADSQHAERRPERRSVKDERDGQDSGRAEAHGQSGTRSPVCELADADGQRTRADAEALQEGQRESRCAGDMGDTNDTGSQGRSLPRATGGWDSGSERAAGATGTACKDRARKNQPTDWFPERKTSPQTGFQRERFPTNGFWSDAEWLPCIDGKMRAVEPGTFPLAYGASARVGRLRAYGNAIVAPQAAAFVRAYLEHDDENTNGGSACFCKLSELFMAIR